MRRGNAACSRVTAERVAVERDSLALALVHVLRGECHVTVDGEVHPHLRCHREVPAHVAEQRSCGTREVVPIARQALERSLACDEEMLPVLGRRRVAIFHDEVRYLPIQGTAELVHRSPPIPSVSLFASPCGQRGRVFQRGAKSLQSNVKLQLTCRSEGDRTAGTDLSRAPVCPDEGRDLAA